MVRKQENEPTPRTLAHLKEIGGLTNPDLATFAGVPEATVVRWESGGLDKRAREMQPAISDLFGVVTRLSEYYAPEEARTWLYARHPQLDGRRATDMIRDGQSEQVVAILDRLDADAYI